MNFREKEKQVLDQILGPGRYDARIRPSGINGTGEGHPGPMHTHVACWNRDSNPLHLRLCLRDAPRQRFKTLLRNADIPDVAKVLTHK